MAKKFHSSGNYEGIDARRKLEHADAEMIGLDHSMHHANMPSDVIMKPYPKSHSALNGDINDKLSGIDHQIDFDESKRHKYLNPKKV
jgi:hypothetical protein